MSELDRESRAAILSKVLGTVETKHFDPRFDKDGWRAEVDRRCAQVLDAASRSEFEATLSDLVRSFGTPDAGFFHESSRKKAPKGLAARFQYWQPDECAPRCTQPSDPGGVMISKLTGDIGWLKGTNVDGTIGVAIANQIG